MIRHYTITDEEYLTHDIITDVEYLITENEIDISSDNTCFCRMRRIETIDKAELLNKYKKVNQLSKELNVKVSRKSGYKKLIVENWNKLENDILLANKLFDFAIIWAKRVEKRKLRYGYNQDRYDDTLTAIRWKHEEMHRRTSLYSEIKEIESHLNKLIPQLESMKAGTNKDCGIAKIVL